MNLLLNKVIIEKNLNNDSQNQRINDAKEMLNSILIQRNILLFLCSIYLIGLIVLILAVNKQ